RTEAVEVDGHDGPRAWRDSGLDPRRVDVARLRVAVHEHRLGPRDPDRFGGGEEGIGRSDDFISRLDAEGEEHEPEGVGARVQSHRVLHAEVPREVLLELLEGRAHHVLVALQDAQDRVVELLLDAAVLPDVAVEGSLHRRRGHLSNLAFARSLRIYRPRPAASKPAVPGRCPPVTESRAPRTEGPMTAGSYAETYRRSLEDREAFWAEAAADLRWERRWDRVLDDSRAPFYRWFAGGRLNTCFNALDVHVEAGRGDQVALIHDSAVTGTVERITYSELRDRVARGAGALRAM